MAGWLELEGVQSGAVPRGPLGPRSMRWGGQGQNMTRTWLYPRTGAPKAALVRLKVLDESWPGAAPGEHWHPSVPWRTSGAEAPGQRQLLGQHHLGSVAGARKSTD